MEAAGRRRSRWAPGLYVARLAAIGPLHWCHMRSRMTDGLGADYATPSGTARGGRQISAKNRLNLTIL